MARSKKSRAEELRFIAGFLNAPSNLVQAFRAEPSGGNAKLEGIDFVWGNVADLLTSMNTEQVSTHDAVFTSLDPKYVVHLDNLSNRQKKLMIDEYEIPSESLSFQSNKADLLLVDKNDNLIYISLKDEEKITKLSQVANKNYGSAKLVGGFSGVDLDQFQYPTEISYNDTWLTAEQWDTLRTKRKDKRCAYIKKKYPVEWRLLVDKSLEAAYQCLWDFSTCLKQDKDCISQFVLLSLVGESVAIENFYIVFGKNLINVQQLLKNIETMNFQVETETYMSSGQLHKESLIIWLVFPNRRYCLTKIEPAFDGGFDNTASQTKGIQYYFQQWPTQAATNDSDGVNAYDFKEFLLDISQ